MSNYFDLDVIEAEQSLVTMTLVHGVRNLGRVMDPSTLDKDLKPGTSVDAPLWLASRLATQGMALLDPPVVYCDRYKKKMDAGQDCMNLKCRAPFFYSVGFVLYGHLRDPTLASYLIRTFTKRYELLVCQSLRAQAGSSVLKTVSKLSAEELQGFERGASSVQAYQRWLHGGPNLTKRKRLGSKDDKENQPPAGAFAHKK